MNDHLDEDGEDFPEAAGLAIVMGLTILALIVAYPILAIAGLA